MTPSWRTHAACLGSAEPWLWDATVDDDGRETRDARAARHGLAVTICRRCPVTAACLADARPGRDEGIRGGVALRPLQQINRPVRKGRAA